MAFSRAVTITTVTNAVFSSLLALCLASITLALKLSELQETIELAQAGKSQKALNVVTSNLGSAYMMQLRFHINLLIEDEKSELIALQAEQDRNKETFTHMFFGFVGLIICGALLSYRLISRMIVAPLISLTKIIANMKNGKTKDTFQHTSASKEVSHLAEVFFELQMQLNNKTTQLLQRSLPVGQHLAMVNKALESSSSLMTLINDMIHCNTDKLSQTRWHGDPI